MTFRLCLTVLAAMLFTSCQISENIYINQDGGGKLAFDVDASGLMSMAGEELKSEKDMDSTFTFKALLSAKKDSISKLPAQEQARLKKMENVSVNMIMNAEKKLLLISMYMDFKKADELIDMMQSMNAIRPKPSADEPDNPLNQFGNSDNTEVSFEFKGNKFRRTVKVKDKKLLQTRKDTTGMTAMMFGGSNYTLKYHFPRKVKTVSNPAAMFSQDRKTVTVLYPLADYIENPESLNLEVVLEKK